MSPSSNLWAGDAARREGDTRPRPTGRHQPPPAEVPGPTVPETASLAERVSAHGRWVSIAGVAAVALLAFAGGLAVGGADEQSSGGPAPAPVASVPGRGGGDTDVGRVYAAAGPAVASVQVSRPGGAASGTGFLVDGEGTLVTNAHVVGDGQDARVRFGDDTRELDAEVLGTDPSSDLAVLEVDPAAVGSVSPLGLADSAEVRVGDAVVAIGNPLGLDQTATAGIVSGLEREIEAPNGFQIDEVIQTDAPINPGNSGGPLLNGRGQVIGVNSQIATAGASGNIGIGFAVPADTLRSVLPRLKAGETIERPYLGVTTAEASGSGAAVAGVASAGPASRAGIRPGEDTIVGLNGRMVRGPDDVLSGIEGLEPGDRVSIVVERDGRRRTISVRLEDRPRSLPSIPGP